jgi:hypothetical protein
VVGQGLFGSRDAASRSDSADRRRDRAFEVVRRYQANLRIVDHLARGFSFEALYFWQPIVYEKQSLTPPERAGYEWKPSFSGFWAVVYEAMRSSSELRAHPRFFDLSREFSRSKELVFFDLCHTTEAGYERIAQAILVPIEKALRARSSPAASDAS